MDDSAETQAPLGTTMEDLLKLRERVRSLEPTRRIDERIAGVPFHAALAIRHVVCGKVIAEYGWAEGVHGLTVRLRKMKPIYKNPVLQPDMDALAIALEKLATTIADDRRDEARPATGQTSSDEEFRLIGELFAELMQKTEAYFDYSLRKKFADEVVLELAPDADPTMESPDDIWRPHILRCLDCGVRVETSLQEVETAINNGRTVLRLPWSKERANVTRRSNDIR